MIHTFIAIHLVFLCFPHLQVATKDENPTLSKALEVRSSLDIFSVEEGPWRQRWELIFSRASTWSVLRDPNINDHVGKK